MDISPISKSLDKSVRKNENLTPLSKKQTIGGARPLSEKKSINEKEKKDPRENDKVNSQ